MNLYKKLSILIWLIFQCNAPRAVLNYQESMLLQPSKWAPFSKKHITEFTQEELKNLDLMQIIPLKQILKFSKNIQYRKLTDSIKLDLIKFPLFSSVAWWMEDIIIPETFLLTIADGAVYSEQGLVIVDDNQLIEELIWQASALKRGAVLTTKDLPQRKKIAGKVVVITQAGCWNYYHWMVEVLPKLSFLKEYNIAYDFLYLPLYIPWMQETIQLLGIDSSKIIEPFGDNKFIQADELQVPSNVSRFGYTPQSVIQFLRESFLSKIDKSVASKKFVKKVFISRRKATRRKILNEDEIFNLFKVYGFKRYVLEDMSVLEQVMLFAQAEIIVAEHGAGLTNILFCQPNTDIIEIFQLREDATFWYLSQQLGLNHTCIKTVDFNNSAENVDIVIPLQPIQDVIEKMEL